MATEHLVGTFSPNDSDYPRLKFDNSLSGDQPRPTYPGDDLLHDKSRSREERALRTIDLVQSTIGNTPHLDPINQVMDLACQDLRRQFGEDSFPNLVEVPKPAWLKDIVQVVNGTIAQIYPEAFQLSLDHILWLDKKGLQTMYEALPTPNVASTYKRLEAIGGKSLGKEPYASNITHYDDLTIDPPQILIAADRYRNIDKPLDSKTVFTLQFELLNDLMEGVIARSVNPELAIIHPEIIKLFDKLLNLERQNLSRTQRDIRKEDLDELINEYKGLIQNPNGIVEVLGGRIRYISTENPEQFPVSPFYDPIISLGTNFNINIAQYLSEKPLRIATNQVIAASTPETQAMRKAIFTKLHDDNSKEHKRTRDFLASIGILGYEATYDRFNQNQIMHHYLTAKEKNPRLEYPLR